MTENTQIGKVEEFDKNGVINLPIGHYAVVNTISRMNKLYPKLSIFGLGSCIALILCDYVHKICGMSHILLPKTTKKMIIYPHKFANLSAKLLMQELINHGAVRDKIKAIILGGSRIFNLDNNIMGFDNIGSIKKELDKLGIEIIKEDIGGSKGRIIIFDSKDFTLYFKSTDQNKFNKFTNIK
ncbi:MAG: chemotaxis protein CheD [Candidatus Thorarchaeota archaeon]